MRYRLAPLLPAAIYRLRRVCQILGRADSSGHTVVFDAGRMARPTIYTASALRLVDSDRFEWVTLDGSSRSVFNRIGHS